MVTLSDIREEAERQLQASAAGAPLDAVTCELIAFAVRLSVTTLDSAGAKLHAERALALGANADQLHEVALLVSGLGVHSLFEGTRLVNRLTAVEGEAAPAMDEGRQQLWDKWIGQEGYWNGFEREVPGFLKDLLQASPQGFDAFFRYCAVPWKSGHLPVLVKELVSMAVDATPTHRFLPGMRLHLGNAIRLGAGRDMVMKALEIAAAAPQHPGVA
ncbi:MAG: carboxymuconolactone decarboxylase family protein [Pseudomonadota bacterium]